MYTPKSSARSLRQLSRTLSRPQCRLLATLPPRTTPITPTAPPNTILSPATDATSKPLKRAPPRLDPVSLHRLEAMRRAHYKRRSYYAALGLVFSAIGMYVSISLYQEELAKLNPNPPVSMDNTGGRPSDALVVLGRERKLVVQKLGEEPEERPDLVPSGTTSVAGFPRVIDFVDRGENGDGTGLGEAEYQLLGLGIRTVSFLGIEVYVVGMYIATDDIARFQEALIRKIDPIASTLVAGEKEKLKALLLDPEKSEEVWNSVLKETGTRTLIRIVPTKNTDFHHLRDAWVRVITSRAQKPAYKAECSDEAFGEAVGQLKTMLNRGTVPKGKEFLLARNGRGKLAVWYDDGKVGAQRLGQVEDERISRALWLNYLAGKTVASEPARKSIVEGVMEFVERPIGTVAAQVHI